MHLRVYVRCECVINLYGILHNTKSVFGLIRYEKSFFRVTESSVYSVVLYRMAGAEVQ